jgi:hypothetical protein
LERGGGIETIIIDTGIVYALADKKDAWHKRSGNFIEGFDGRLVLPSPAIPEICYLLNKFLGEAVERTFLDSLIRRELLTEHFNIHDLKRSVEILKKYKNLNIGFVDASIVAISERLGIPKILTADRRHFSAIQPKHCAAFTLLP